MKAHNFWKMFITFLKYLAIAVVVIAIVVYAFFYFNVCLTAGIDSAGPRIPAEPFKQIWSQRPVLLLGIGDSITDGFGVPEGYSYFDRLIKNQPNDSCDIAGRNLSVVFPKLTAQNIAVSGSVSTQHLKAIQNFPVQSSDILGVVVITTGGNDLIHNYGRKVHRSRFITSQSRVISIKNRYFRGYEMGCKECAMYGATFEMAKPWIQNYKERLEKMIVDITRKFPGSCYIFLANIYDPSDGIGNTNEWLTGLPHWPDGLLILAEYNKIISQCADKYDNVYLVDIYSSFLGHGIHCKKFWLKHYRFNDPHYWYNINIEDPNPGGYDAIRRLFLLEMIKVFVNNK